MNSTEPIDFFRHARHAVHVHSSSVKSYARLSHDPTRIPMRSPLTRRGTCCFIGPQPHPDSPSGSDATHVTPVRESDYSQKALAALRTLFNGVLRRDTAGSAPRAKPGVYIRRPQIHPGDHHRLRD